MHLFSILLVLLIGGAFVTLPAMEAFRSIRSKNMERWGKVIALCLVSLGGAGFFGSALSAVGGLAWLPHTFEWPVGSAKGILTLPDGKHVVPVQAANRIQIYDPGWHFLNGWYVDAHAGYFDLRQAGGSNIEVRTARRQQRYVYTPDGTLLSSGTYEIGAYDNSPAANGVVRVPTPWWFWIFTSPLHSWLLIIAGAALLHLSTRKKPAAKTAP